MKKDDNVSKDPKYIHDSIPQQNLLDQEIDSSVRCESAMEDLLEMPCDNVYGNFEEKCAHSVSKVEDKNKIENKCDKTLSNLGTTSHDAPMKKKKLVEYNDDDDVFEIRDKEKEETANHAVSKTSTVKNSNESSVKEILIESNSDKKHVHNQSVCSLYDPFNPTSTNVENDGTDIETESNKKVGVTHKTTVNPTVEHSSKIEIETDCDEKEGNSHKTTSKSTVEDLSKTEIKTDSNLTVGKLKKMTAKAIEDHSF